MWVGNVSFLLVRLSLMRVGVVDRWDGWRGWVMFLSFLLFGFLFAANEGWGSWSPRWVGDVSFLSPADPLFGSVLGVGAVVARAQVGDVYFPLPLQSPFVLLVMGLGRAVARGYVFFISISHSLAWVFLWGMLSIDCPSYRSSSQDTINLLWCIMSSRSTTCTSNISCTNHAQSSLMGVRPPM